MGWPERVRHMAGVQVGNGWTDHEKHGRQRDEPAGDLESSLAHVDADGTMQLDEDAIGQMEPQLRIARLRESCCSRERSEAEGR